MGVVCSLNAQLAPRRRRVVQTRAVTSAATPVAAHGGIELSALIERLAQHDRSAMQELYETTSTRVYGLALRIVGNRESAEDVAVEVYAQVWRDAATYNAARGTPYSWLLTLTRSRAIDMVRARRHDEVTDSVEITGALECQRPGPEAVSAEVERGHFVRGAIARLAPEQREAIELAFFRGLSHSEIAQRLDQPLGTVKTRIRMGMLKLRSLLSHLDTPALASVEG